MSRPIFEFINATAAREPLAIERDSNGYRYKLYGGAKPKVDADNGSGVPIGMMKLKPRAWGGEGYEIDYITVAEQYKRQGVATKMLEVARAQWTVEHSSDLTDEGKAWSQHVGLLHTAGPGSGVIPMRVRAEPPANPRRPRPVVVDPVAAADIRDLDQGDQKKVRQIIKRIERGEVEVERKHRPPLQDCFTVDVGYSLRLLMYLNTDGAWHIAYAGYHDYDEAERRMVAAASGPTQVTIDGVDYIWNPGTNSVSALVDDRAIGKLDLFDWGQGEGVEVDFVHVDPQHQRKGIASKMLEIARAKMAPVEVNHSTMLTGDGEAWSQHVGSASCRYGHPERIAAAEHLLATAEEQPKESRREHMRSIANGALRNIRHAMETCPDCSDSMVMTAVQEPPAGLRFEDAITDKGGLVMAYVGATQVGALSWSFPALKSWEGRAAISSVDVQPDWRRMGVAASMLEHARSKVSYPIEHSPSRTPDGDAWMGAVGAKKTWTKDDIDFHPGDSVRPTRRGSNVWIIRDYSTPHPAVVGALEWHIKDNPAPDYGYTYVVDGIQVNPAYRRQGVGTLLGGELKAWADRNGDDFDPGKFTDEGAALWRSMTGEDVRGTEQMPGANDRGRYGSSWRALVADAYWDAYDVTISSDGGASGRKAYEIHVGGKPFANRPSLGEAKAAVEEQYGPQDWKTVRTDKMVADHYHFGETTEFTAPTTIWAADFA